MCEHCPVCDLKAAQGFASAAVTLFIPVAVLPGLNELGNISRFFIPKPRKKASSLLFFQAPVDKNSGMGESLHKFQAAPNDRMFSFSSVFSQQDFGRCKSFFNHIYSWLRPTKKNTKHILTQGIMQ